jgi:hypothetical protein
MNDGIKFMILFFWCIGMLFFMNNQTLFIIQFILFLIACCWFAYPYFSFNFNNRFKEYYELKEEERPIWETIVKKAIEGYNEYEDQTKNNEYSYMCPWTKPLEQNEYDLLDKIHKKYYGEDWYITDPIGGTQATYIMYEDVKDKVR